MSLWIGFEPLFISFSLMSIFAVDIARKCLLNLSLKGKLLVLVKGYNFAIRLSRISEDS